MEIFSNLSELLIALCVGVITWNQYKLSRRLLYIDSQRIKQELFDRRMESIRQIGLYIRPWGCSDSGQFLAHIEREKFLFPESAVVELKLMWEIGHKYLERLQRKSANVDESPESRKERHNIDLVEKMSSKYRKFIGKSEYLLKIEEYKI